MLFFLCLAVYTSRMAPSLVPGDPGEYQIVASQWGIGHPPGYGLYALIGNLFTRLIFWGEPAWRVNLLSAVCGAAIATLVYGIGRMQSRQPAASLRGQAPALLGALMLAAGLGVWQHAIHANAHIVTAWLAVLSLFCLLRWQHTGRDAWLFGWCVIAGASPAHHPLLIFAWPAYGLFILMARPRLWQEWKTWLRMLGWGLVGLSALLYYPIRCAIGVPPLPGPSDMNTWVGFVRVITAQGLRVNIGGFSWRDMVYRLWDVRVLSSLQFAPPALLLAVIGLVQSWRQGWRSALLLGSYVLCIVLITINVLQDAMAYLLGPLAVMGVWIALGVDVLLEWTGRLSQLKRYVWVNGIMIALVGIIPLQTASVNWTKMNLSDFDDANEWLDMIERRFVGQGQHAVVLVEWERMTPAYYDMQVRGRRWSPDDVELIHIPASKTFVQSIAENIERGPVYLTSYRAAAAAVYRLMPSGELWQALPAWLHELPVEAQPIHLTAQERIEVMGWQLNQTTAQPGDVLLLDLYLRMSQPEGVEAQQYYLSWARLGETTFYFTTDSRFNTPWWQPGEIVVERFELPVPWHMTAGVYPLQVGMRLVNQGRDLFWQNGETLAPLTEIQVQDAIWRPSTAILERALGNLHGDVLLRAARINGIAAHPGSEQRLVIRPGCTLRVELDWESLRPIQENYTLFVQLLDMNLHVQAQRDMTPLSGSAPTWLWFPRWRRGTRITDTRLLDLPATMPPGPYPLVVGIYGFNTGKRVQAVLPNGDVQGDWITLGHLWVE